MAQELQSKEPITLGEARLGALFGRGYGWVQKLDPEDMITRSQCRGRARSVRSGRGCTLDRGIADGGQPAQARTGQDCGSKAADQKMKPEIAIKEGRLVDKEELF